MITKTNEDGLPAEKDERTAFLMRNKLGTSSFSKMISQTLSRSALELKLLAMSSEYSFGSTLKINYQ
jgi:hypothetical protein